MTDKLVHSLMDIQESQMEVATAFVAFADYVQDLALRTGYRTPETVNEIIEVSEFMEWLAKPYLDTPPETPDTSS